MNAILALATKELDEGKASLKVVFFIALVVAFYGLLLYGQAIGAEAALAQTREEQQAIVADYEDALAHAQREYDALRDTSNAVIAELEMELAVEQDTKEWWRAEADQKAAEASRWMSLANVLRGLAY